MQPSTFTFVADDGAEIVVHRWLPDERPKAVVQIAHGMVEHAARYAGFARALADEGYAVYADDHRGHGLTAKSDDELGHFADEGGWRKVLGDLRQLSAIIRRDHPGVPLFLMGHSMGSFFTQHYLVEFPGEADGAILSGTRGKLNAVESLGALPAKLEQKRLGARGKSKLLWSLGFAPFNKGFKPARTELDWLSRDPKVVDEYIADPRCGFLVTTTMWLDIMEGLAVVSDYKTHARIPKDLPIYVFSGEKCPVGANTKTVRDLIAGYHKAGLTRVEHRFYEDGRHEMLNEINKREVYDDVIAWLERARAAAAEKKSAA